MTPLLDVVPFARTLGIAFTSVTPTSAVAVLADDPRLHNHVGGPHAGALFSLAETASGAVVLAAFGSALDRAVPLAVRASIGYSKLALGTVTAHATLARPATEVLAELDAGTRPEFDVLVQLTNAEGVQTAEMTVTWTLRLNR
jgi:acyl-coenzyme A thioesterase PaaI-like protein